MFSISRYVLLALSVIFALPCIAESIKISAPKGSLIIVGGGETPIDVQKRFVTLAGGPGKARIAIFPMASTEFDEESMEVVIDFQMLDAEVQVINFSRVEAQTDSLKRLLEGFSGYWFLGGDQTRLADTLLATQALETVERRYEEGAVVGGTSAGAAVMTTAMLTGKRHGPAISPENAATTIARGTFVISKGFGFLPGAIVDQHFLKRARYNRLLSAVLEQPELIGAGIDEETAILVRPDGFWEVLGASYVKIFDARRAHFTENNVHMVGASGITMHLLPAGSVFDPEQGRVILPGG